MAHILVVCTANICRSPVVEALIRERLVRSGRDAWTVSSAGTLAINGYPASRFSVEVLAERGLRIEGHSSRCAEQDDIAKADLVLCMESGHAEALRIENPQHRERIFLLTEMVDDDRDVADPYGGPRDGYERMIDLVTRLVDDGFQRIVALGGRHAEQRDGAASGAFSVS